MKELSGFTSYGEYKQTLDKELQKTTEGFVKIGYLLKVARDTAILEESGYRSVAEFAQAEYSIDKTTVSRFIRINDRFAENGYSDQLESRYVQFGYAKLAIMLQMPDEIIEGITPDYSKSEIQAIKDEVDEEKKISDLEIIMEGENDQQHHLNRNMDKVLHQLGRDNPELYIQLWDVVKGAAHDETTGIAVSRLLDVLAPSEVGTYSVRVQGIGRFLISIQGAESSISLVNVRTGEKEIYSWEKVIEALKVLCVSGEGAEKSWEELYREEYPKPPIGEAAPVQQYQQKKPEPKKQVKVTKAKTEPKMPESKTVLHEENRKQEETAETEEAVEIKKASVNTDEEPPESETEEVAPVQQEQEKELQKTDHPTASSLIEDAESFLDKVKEAMKENQYLLAAVKARYLLETLTKLCKTVEEKQIDGQMEINDYIGEEPDV